MLKVPDSRKDFNSSVDSMDSCLNTLTELGLWLSVFDMGRTWTCDLLPKGLN